MTTLRKVNLQLNFLSWPEFSKEEIEKTSAILASGKVNYWTGEEGRLFEMEFAAAMGTRYAVALMNGTVALESAVLALGLVPGDEIITTSRTFIATASAFIRYGIKAVFADVDPVSQNITAETIKQVLTPKTKAIILVHLAGWPCEMDAINALAKENNLFVIEDCAQAHGGQYRGRSTGSLGTIAAFSFCQDKIMTTGGEGGMITTDDPELWEKIWSLKDHGKSYRAVFETVHPPGFKWLHESFGTNWRMTEIQAAIGRIQLRRLPSWHEKRTHHANILTEAFSNIAGLRITEPPKHIKHAYYKYYAFIKPEKLKKGWDRDRIMIAINAKGVPCYSGICSEIYLEKAFSACDPQARLPAAKRLGETSLMFLVHPTLTDAHMHYAADVVKSVMEEASICHPGI